ncbi:hypothetical protein GUITHDRAFT_165912 [Guillardia theta CCMP2712]|uniref:RRM domain-containing protein n=2 Tax=Guillardia theta TaxID=55529 RepID=L1IHW3_GUITC|nr:hypothetical protein GUITHDRAFT_165912 [Guillardia theta CCMP2712]EKX35697.1 hypothetical protein GUITHDRAFT_165912 [Guillardia theta CCMP2712]|eukprot:XP_005822677.1 hypothetical protein GUITHDRAFT_165912 [Guillardia theta CCMP2712]
MKGVPHGATLPQLLSLLSSSASSSAPPPSPSNMPPPGPPGPHAGFLSTSSFPPLAPPMGMQGEIPNPHSGMFPPSPPSCSPPLSHPSSPPALPLPCSAQVVFDRLPTDPAYPQLAYLNFQDAESAHLAKNVLRVYVDHLRFHAGEGRCPPPPMDCSRLSISIKGEPVPNFTIFVGNVYDEDEASLSSTFGVFGSLCSLSIHGLPPVKLMDGCAFVNFVSFMDAAAALRACENREVILGKRGGCIAEARPNHNILYVEEVKRLLESRPMQSMSFQEAERITTFMEGKHRPPSGVEVLIRCQGLFCVDSYDRTITLAPPPLLSSPPPPRSLPAQVPMSECAAAFELPRDQGQTPPRGLPVGCRAAPQEKVAASPLQQLWGWQSLPGVDRALLA